MPTSRFVRLGPEEDRRLREIEQDPLLKPKVRLRAQVLRLSGRGESVERIAAYTERSRASVCRDFDRWKHSAASRVSPKARPPATRHA